ncbi:hypothetical protein COBT_001183 [Conglomerata obtusa]
MLIKLIPDTNILINHHNSILKHFKSQKPKISFYIPRTVLNELDTLKIYDQNARSAVELIRIYHLTRYIRLEGQGNVGRMEIDPSEYDVPHSDIVNNDDKILKFAYDHKDFLLVTGDKVMALKAVSYGLKCILDETNDFESILGNVIECVGSNSNFCDDEMVDVNVFCENKNFSYVKRDSKAFEIKYCDKPIQTEKENNNEVNECKSAKKTSELCNDFDKKELIEKVYHHIKHKIDDILHEQKLKTNKSRTIYNDLEFVTNNFTIFCIYLPKNSKDDLINIYDSLLLQENFDLKKDLRKLLVIFGMADVKL